MGQGLKLARLTANFGSSLRSERLQGREYLVAPVSMLVPGVLSGSFGPLLYTLEDVAANAKDWNNLPLLIYHPQKNGRYIPADSPGVLERQGVGMLQNTRIDKRGRLVAEAWFDVKRIREVDYQVYRALVKGEPIEASTGMFNNSIDMTPGVFRGKTYRGVVKSYQPDHLAILPDQIGACSLRDGCGVNVNKSSRRIKAMPKSSSRSQGKARYTEEELRRKRKGMKRKGMKPMMTGKMPPDKMMTNKRPASHAGSSSSSGEPDMTKLNDKQRRELVDGLINNCDCGATAKEKGPWEEGDREILNGLSDGKLQALDTQRKKQTVVVNTGTETKMTDTETKKETDTETKKEQEVTTNTKVESQQPKTYKEWLSEAPAEVKTLLTNAQRVLDGQKTAFVEKIVANERNKFTKEYLMAKDVDELGAIAALLPETQTQPYARFIGQAAPLVNANSFGDSFRDEDQDMVPATIDWAEAKRLREGA